MISEIKNAVNFKTTLLVWTCLLMILFGGCKQHHKEGLVIAKVGKKSLMLHDVLEEIPPQFRKNLTSSEIKEYALRWVNNEVLYQEAMNRELDKSQKFQKEFENLKKELLINELIEESINKKIKVTDQEIQKYYEENGDSYILSEDIIHAYHILVQTKKEANAISKRLSNKKEAFLDIVKETYKDSLTSVDWDLGYFSKSEIIPEIAKVIFNLPVGSHSYPIKSEFGYHIIKVVDKQKKGEKKKLALIKQEIKLKIEELKKQRIYQRFLLQTKSNFEINTYFPLLNSVVIDSLFRKGDE